MATRPLVTVYIILASNSYHKVSAYGTKVARPFRSEASANKALRKYEKAHPNLDFIVLPVNEGEF